MRVNNLYCWEFAVLQVTESTPEAYVYRLSNPTCTVLVAEPPQSIDCWELGSTRRPIWGCLRHSLDALARTLVPYCLFSFLIINRSTRLDSYNTFHVSHFVRAFIALLSHPFPHYSISVSTTHSIPLLLFQLALYLYDTHNLTHISEILRVTRPNYLLPGGWTSSIHVGQLFDQLSGGPVGWLNGQRAKRASRRQWRMSDHKALPARSALYLSSRLTVWHGSISYLCRKFPTLTLFSRVSTGLLATVGP